MISICTQFWNSNPKSYDFSTMYDESWVEKLYRGCQRNLSEPFRFLVWSEKHRTYAHAQIEHRLLDDPEPGYASCIQLYELNEPQIIMGLDTVITGNIDHLAAYALTSPKLALPRDPNSPYMACNGVCLVPAGHSHIWTRHDGSNDMIWMRRQPHDYIDDLFPGHVRSWKGGVLPGVRETGLLDTRICYFHGHEKMHEISERWLLDHWV